MATARGGEAGSAPASPARPAAQDGQPTRRTPAAAPVLLTVTVAIAVLLPAGMLTDAFAPPVSALFDPGAVVRWGLPVVRLVHDVAAAATVGLLLLAATVLPDGRTTRRRLTATRYAAVAGAVWVVAAVVALVLTFADIADLQPSDPGFLSALAGSIGPVETLRVAAISAALALVVATGAALVRSRAGTVWLGVLAIVAVLPLALSGHAAGSASHETAVTSLALHLVAALVWVGGLLALVVLKPVLGAALPVSVSRFSTLAAWCFAAVALSGVLNAWVRLGSLGDLATAYGVLVLAKATALVLLGFAGLVQRRSVVWRLRSEPGSSRAFARLALGELVVMGAAFGLGTALSRSRPPVPDAPSSSTVAVSLTGYPAPGPLTSSAWLTAWRVDWLWATVAVLAVAVYLAWALRLVRRGDRWPVLRALSWVSGWLVFAWATNGAPEIYGRVLFSAHMVMHMLIAMVVPILLVLAAPVTLALRALPARSDGTWGPRELLLGLVHSRYLGLLANPVVAAVLFFASLVVFYYSPLFGLALSTHTGHALMTLHFLLTGYLFAWALVGVDPGPAKWPPSLRLVVLFSTVSFHAFFGVALTSSSSVLAPEFFDQLRLPWLVDRLADQHTGGAIAWGVGELPTLLLAMLVTAAWVRSDAAETRRLDRQADRDDDAELKAYNARLAAYAAHPAAPSRE